MRTEEIKSKMILKKKKQVDIAKIADVTPAAVCMIINGRGRSKRIQEIIANELGEDFANLWGVSA